MGNRDDYHYYGLRTRRRVGLTPTEQKVILSVLSGNVTRHDIAMDCEMSPRTVATHLDSIFDKTYAVNLTDVVLMAVGLKPAPFDLGIAETLAEIIEASSGA